MTLFSFHKNGFFTLVTDKKDTSAEKVFLPFEGDRGFSILLSKAFMLADDDKITDPTIINQLPKG